jgi:hypothetical protein
VGKAKHKQPAKKLTKADKIAYGALIVGVLTLISATLVVPEVRR